MADKVFRTELNPVDLLERAAFVYPNKVGLVHGDRRYTYAELGERAWRLANALRDAGLEKGDRVAALLPNSPAMLEAHFGVPAAGGILVTVNTRLSSSEIAHILEHSGSRFLLLDAELAELVDPIEGGVRVIRVDDTGRSQRPLRAAPGRRIDRTAGQLARGRGGDDLGQLHLRHHRSSERRPVHHRGAYLNALKRRCGRPIPGVAIPLDAADVPLQRLVLHLGGHRRRWRHVNFRSDDPDVIWDLIDAEGVTHFCGAPTVQLMVINHAEGPPRRAPHHGRRRRRAALPDALRAHGRAELPRRPRLRPNRNVRSASRCARTGRVG